MGCAQYELGATPPGRQMLVWLLGGSSSALCGIVEGEYWQSPRLVLQVWPCGQLESDVQAVFSPGLMGVKKHVPPVHSLTWLVQVQLVAVPQLACVLQVVFDPLGPKHSPVLVSQVNPVSHPACAHDAPSRPTHSFCDSVTVDAELPPAHTVLGACWQVLLLRSH
jgi:hypothetical protein